MISSSDRETEAFGKSLAKQLKNGDIVALHGDLGTGKTTFVKGVVEQLTDIKKIEVQSPTFTYLHIYEAEKPIFHFDLYRLPTLETFLHMGFLDYLEEEGICLIEWPEKIASLLPKTTFHVYFTHMQRKTRRIDVY